MHSTGGKDRVIRFNNLTDDDGFMNVFFNPEILRNDGQALAILAHEAKEINLLEDYFNVNRRGISISKYENLVISNSAANFHGKAVRYGDGVGAKYMIENGLMTKDDWAEILMNKYYGTR